MRFSERLYVHICGLVASKEVQGGRIDYITLTGLI